MAAKQPSPILHDEEFYLRDAIFLIEDRLFKVHVCHFTDESAVFQAMFELPPGPDSEADGLTDERPIVLEGIKKNDFRRLLRVMYARGFKEIGMLTEEEWVSVLVLSTLWQMDRLRGLAIAKLTKILNDGRTLVNLGRKYNVDSWVISGLEKLVARKEPMDEEDVRSIGISDVLKVSALREWTARMIDESKIPLDRKISSSQQCSLSRSH
ncbi:hypothetical protein GALMADRAFT_69119 [Galerina marginata CBS 339.88]|uniref:BTB domain-containing protein n=1 Tax=Galerina marginata (strain CBS 339.88) TaxID=685588 RepID=A0A067SX39_GALM3|nr:hypothetical protein GALMADRAFT_69119 [Galerina marginata CBS 339.88]